MKISDLGSKLATILNRYAEKLLRPIKCDQDLFAPTLCNSFSNKRNMSLATEELSDCI